MKEKGGSGGMDGVTLDQYEATLSENIEDLLQRLRAKEYRPTSVRRVYLPKKNGKIRPLGIPTIEDRRVQQAIMNVLYPKFEGEIYHNWSCGYREGLGAQRVLPIILWNLETGYKHIYDCDIRGFLTTFLTRN